MIARYRGVQDLGSSFSREQWPLGLQLGSLGMVRPPPGLPVGLRGSASFVVGTLDDAATRSIRLVTRRCEVSLHLCRSPAPLPGIRRQRTWGATDACLVPASERTTTSKATRRNRLTTEDQNRSSPPLCAWCLQ